MKKVVLFIILLEATIFTIGATNYSAIISPKYWDLRRIYADSLCRDTCRDPYAAKGLYFNDLCVTEYYTNDNARTTPHYHVGDCKTWFSDDIVRSDEYTTFGDTIRFWDKSYLLWKVSEDTLVLKEVQSPHRLYCYQLSEDQKSPIKNTEVMPYLKRLQQYIKVENIFFEGENGLDQKFVLYDRTLTKAMKIKVFFKLNFHDEQLEVTNFKIYKIKISDVDTNVWNDLDEVSSKQYADELSNCVHHISFVPKDGIETIPWKELNKSLALPIVFSVFPIR